nr:ferredoxin-type protein NapF [Azospirillum sp. SYSU D00513]
MRGKARTAPDAIRPPWSRADLFTSLCTRCGSCAGACPETILRPGDGGFPEVDFSRGECSFCGACAEACPEPVFAITAEGTRDGSAASYSRPWSHVAAVADTCLSAQRVFCRSCGEACPESAIRFALARGGVAQALVDASSCTGCGACVSACPSNSITMKPGGDRLA